METTYDLGPDALFHENKDLCYFCLIFALAANKEWRQRLSCHGHVNRCTSLFDFVRLSTVLVNNFYLFGTHLRIDPSGTDLSLNPFQKRLRMLTSDAWVALRKRV